jgi:hypothetical protein
VTAKDDIFFREILQPVTDMIFEVSFHQEKYVIKVLNALPRKNIKICGIRLKYTLFAAQT